MILAAVQTEPRLLEMLTNQSIGWVRFKGKDTVTGKKKWFCQNGRYCLQNNVGRGVFYAHKQQM